MTRHNEITPAHDLTRAHVPVSQPGCPGSMLATASSCDLDQLQHLIAQDQVCGWC